MFLPSIEPPALHYHVEQHKTLTSPMEQAYRDFLDTYQMQTIATTFDLLRKNEYPLLDAQHHVYLDYTGGSLYAQSQLHQHAHLLAHGVFGNPHSVNPTSQASTELVEQAREQILAYFNASPDEYTVIFTSNATGALKLIGESYPFTQNSLFMLTMDCHNSVTGIREFARAKHATTTYVPLSIADLRIDRDVIHTLLTHVNPEANNLFAFPAQSNFSGVQHPLELIKAAQEKGWDVLLDAAAFVPTNTLDLSIHQPEFVVISFYKMFGYPTGVGCLLCKNTALEKLKRPWFAGGTVDIVSIVGDGHYLHEGPSAFEDGTINYLNISAIASGLQFLKNVGIGTIHSHVIALTNWLLNMLPNVRHSNGKPLVTLYGPPNTHMRGGIIAMNFFDPQGNCIDRDIIVERAADNNISLRTGCFCNPGSIETLNNFSPNTLRPYFTGNHTYTFEEYVNKLGSSLIGAVRVSCGIASNFSDVYAFYQFAKTFIDDQVPQQQSKTHKQQSCSC